jgi:Tfp pilus assembly protein PilX
MVSKIARLEALRKPRLSRRITARISDRTLTYQHAGETDLRSREH